MERTVCLRYLSVFSTSTVLSRRTSLRKIEPSCYRGFKMKPKQTAKKQFTNSDRALEHFDLHYRPVYKEIWPSLRISLLTAKKSCAVMNNFTLENKFLEELQDQGANNIIEKAANEQKKMKMHGERSEDINIVEGNNSERDIETRINEMSNDENNTSNMYSVYDDSKMVEHELTKKEDVLIELNNVFNVTETNIVDSDRTDMYKFIATEIVYSERDDNKIEEARRSVYTPQDVKVDIVTPTTICLPVDLTVMAFQSGDVTEFPDIKSDKPNGHLCFYIMDAASILPVIALDLKKGDSVLDLCAAPGGKSLSILQTGLAERLTCNDLSGSRVARLLNILQFYVPEEKRQHVTITRKSGLTYDQPEYDKVLVDVPCYTDRHVLLEPVNNLFSPKRITERIEMPTLQKDLLISGIKSCRPGGCVVYSTCTLSSAQNDGVIQNTLDELWRISDIDVVVEDLNEITEIFKDTFKFYKKCRFGQLVLPSLSSNYGPMYFCRLRRIK